MYEVMANDKSQLKGIWYPGDLEKYFEKNKGSMPKEYWVGYADPDCFERTAEYTWVLKDGVPPSKAIKALFRGPTVIDCGNAIHICYYKALLDVLGDEKFDILFGTFHRPYRLIITQCGVAQNDNPLYYMSDFSRPAMTGEKGSLGKRPLSIGEECHIAGVPFYAHKHPKGFGGGWNVFYIGNNDKGEQLFIGHGFERPMTEMEIIRKLVERYNWERSPQDDEFIKNSSEKHLFDKKSQPFLKNFYTISDEDQEYLIKDGQLGYLPSVGKSLDIAVIADLIENGVKRDVYVTLATRIVEKSKRENEAKNNATAKV